MYYWLRLAREAVEDWKARGITKPRNILPADGATALTLRCIRRQACKAGGVSDCLIWKAGELAYEPGSNPCTSCKTQGVGLLQLSKELWGIKGGTGQDAGAEIVGIEELRGWINGREPIQPQRLRSGIAKAWSLGWLSTSQAATAMEETSSLEAAGSVARQIFKRLRRSGMTEGDREQFGAMAQREREQMDGDARIKFDSNRHVSAALKGLPDDLSKLHTINLLRAKLRQNCSTESANTC
ncbi:MAG: hypothetical protein HZB40_01575 [Rhodocyclales bacterium]|nr:hypothetical protein [Rhodocyclales bacterium]